MTSESLSALLERSDALAERLEAAFGLPPFGHDPRFRSSTLAGSLALEHGAAVRALFALGLGISAAILLRAQYEATLRAVWACYSATDEEILLMLGDLSAQNDQQAKRLPQAGDMLVMLDGRAPPEAVQSLRNFRTNAWGPLNSFAHAGLHSINRHERGLPLQVADGALRGSNALGLVAAMQCAVATGSQTLVRDIATAQKTFSDCF